MKTNYVLADIQERPTTSGSLPTASNKTHALLPSTILAGAKLRQRPPVRSQQHKPERERQQRDEEHGARADKHAAHVERPVGVRVQPRAQQRAHLPDDIQDRHTCSLSARRRLVVDRPRDDDGDAAEEPHARGEEAQVPHHGRQLEHPRHSEVEVSREAERRVEE